jgi:hypothetical protein
LVVLLQHRKFYNKEEVEYANSQAVLCHEESDDPYACEDMLDSHDFPITKSDHILSWTHFRRNYDSLDYLITDETKKICEENKNQLIDLRPYMNE